MLLSRSFYNQNTVTVAKKLLGKKLVRQIGGHILSGTIVETEAYLGLKDPACHSYHGKVTDRVRVMYKEGGHSYVYFIYGMYYCFNIVTRGKKHPEAVLIRAVIPDTESLATVRKYRKVKDDRNLSNGPGKLCLAYKIDTSLNDIDLTQKNSKIWIEDNKTLKKFKIHTTTRIGIESYGEASKWPLRFVLV